MICFGTSFDIMIALYSRINALTPATVYFFPSIIGFLVFFQKNCEVHRFVVSVYFALIFFFSLSWNICQTEPFVYYKR